ALFLRSYLLSREGPRLLIAGLVTAGFDSDDAASLGLCARDFGAPVSRCPESAASLVLLRLEADERGGRGRRLLPVDERQSGRHQGARPLGQRDETLNVRDMVGVTVENEEERGEQSPPRERGEQSACEPEPEPHRGLSREKRHVTISLSHLACL